MQNIKMNNLHKEKSIKSFDRIMYSLENKQYSKQKIPIWIFTLKLLFVLMFFITIVAVYANN